MLSLNGPIIAYLTHVACLSVVCLFPLSAPVTARVENADDPKASRPTGNYHINDNELVEGRWCEFGWKIEGDRKSPAQKLSWNFGIGAKLHGNPDITDIVCVSFRRSPLD
jgi:hypothetical protein